jgi:hypothetical protein
MFLDVVLPEFRLEAGSDDPLSWFHFIEDALNFDLLLYPKFSCCWCYTITKIWYVLTFGIMETSRIFKTENIS